MKKPKSKRLEDVDVFPIVALCFKLYITVYFRKEGIVATFTNIRTRVELGTTLANQDGTSRYSLSPKSFNAKILGIAITSVSR
jgi:hypothetical protein